jgi:hypothetical protein
MIAPGNIRPREEVVAARMRGKRTVTIAFPARTDVGDDDEVTCGTGDFAPIAPDTDPVRFHIVGTTTPRTHNPSMIVEAFEV